jgi:hypothetical protein
MMSPLPLLLVSLAAAAGDNLASPSQHRGQQTMDNLALESHHPAPRAARVPPAHRTQPLGAACRTVYKQVLLGAGYSCRQVSIVKQVPSFAKHCTKVDDTKCKTVFKNSITTSMETQVAAGEAKCSPLGLSARRPLTQTATPT